MQKITGDLEKDIAALEKAFEGSVDYYVRRTTLHGARCAVVLCDVVAGIEKAWELLMRPLQFTDETFATGEDLMNWLWEGTVLPFSAQKTENLEDARYGMVAGNTILLAEGATFALGFSTQDYVQRSPSPPDTEVNVYGSKEGFCDVLRKNMGLIRRRVRTDGLVMETQKIGLYTGTEVAIIYHRDLVNPQMLKTVREKLKNIKLQMVFDTSYLAPFLESAPFALFGGTGITERPDTLCAKICEGKIAVLADGTPYALLVPYFFNEHFQCMDDYSSRPYYASFIRLLKYAAFFIAILLPGLFVCAANFTPELFPDQLLYKIAAAEAATPLPLFAEAIFVNLLLELVKEAGLRLPKSIGHSVSLVAALIVGDAAVQFGLIGSPVIILLAISAICGFVVPSLYQPVTILRMLFILVAGIYGPAGMLVLFLGMLYRICSIDTYGIPYTAPLTPYTSGGLTDGLLRTGWKSRQGKVYTIKKLPHDNDEGDKK